MSENQFDLQLDFYSKSLSDREYLDLLGRAESRSRNEAAEWRLRCKRQYAIDDRLSKMGVLALLCGSSLLVLNRGSEVKPLKRESRWRPTLYCSELFEQLDQVKRGQLIGLQREPYRRLEESIQVFGQLICLVYRNLNDPVMIQAFGSFKLKAIQLALGTDERVDNVIQYIKWLGKAFQAAFLGTKIPENTSNIEITEEGVYLPLVGELSFINDIFVKGKRTQRMTYMQAQKLAQLGSLPRSLPYPSSREVKDSVKETLDLIQIESRVEPDARAKYRLGLNIMVNNIPRPKSGSSHVSLVGSGCVESSRSEGGRARFLVAKARLFTDQKLGDQMYDLVDKLDQFGSKIIDRSTLDIAKAWNPEKFSEIPLGTLMFVPPFETETVLKSYFEKKITIPKYLAQILNLTAGQLIRGIGEYEPSPSIIHNVLCFESNDVTFNPTRTPYVVADVSIEAGLKCRITTSALAGFAHLSQLPANYMRSYLSQDPFHRVGFEESDKLWEVLKQYRRTADS